MPEGHVVVFHPFRLDLANEQLWRGVQEVPLRPKTFAVLRHLVTHAGRLISKGELLDAVWGDTAVSDVVPIVCVRELRKALGDDAEEPAFIETMARRGYRFIAPITTSSQPIQSSRFKVQGSKNEVTKGWEQGPGPAFPSAFSLQPSAPLRVGRQSELAQLHTLLERALQGERQIVFITGESGIGKTTLVDAFVESLDIGEEESYRRKNSLLVVRGHCIEHHWTGEAYLPLLETTWQACREPWGARLIEILHQYAPTWLMQLPALLSTADYEELQRRTAGATRERMLREMAEAVEVITAERPQILILEDLHWSDYATLDFLALLARRREPARLLVIGTYRSTEELKNGHPLSAMTQETILHRQGMELPLTLLTEADVQAYLLTRLPGLSKDEYTVRRLASVIHQRTEGNPLFLVNVVDYLTSQKVDVLHGASLAALQQILEVVPENVQQMIEKRLDRLSPTDQAILEVASIAGVEFSAATVAAGLAVDVVEVESKCRELARYERFLRTLGVEEWPDGTVATRYSFVHTLYQQVLYSRVTGAQQSRLHRRIGERLEQGYGTSAREKAAELARHFTLGRDAQRAVLYLYHAAAIAKRRFAFQEVWNYGRKAIELLRNWPETPKQTKQELACLLQIVGPLMALKGEADPEVEMTYTRIVQLYKQLGEVEPPFMAVLGLWVVHMVRGHVAVAHSLVDQLLVQATTRDEPQTWLWTHHARGVTLLYRGEFIAARLSLKHAAELYSKLTRPSFMFDPKMAGLALDALLLWILGYPQQALQTCNQAVAWARELAHPYSEAFALSLSACLYVNLHAGDAAHARTEAFVTIAREYNFKNFLAAGKLFRGAACIERGEIEEGIPLVAEGIPALRSTGAGLHMSAWLAFYAAALGKVGRVEEGLEVMRGAENLVARSGESFYLAELYRIKGELTLQQFKVQSSRFKVENPHSVLCTSHSEAEVCFLQALDIARRQEAKTFELRAATSLGRLWQEQGRTQEAYQLLDSVYRWFSEGFATADLQEARAVLEALK